MAKQLEFKKVKGWGGKRSGAGRPNRTGQVSHGKRDPVDLRKPLHITLKLKNRVANLRNNRTLKDFRLAIAKAKDFGLFVVHFSLQSNHLHMIVEVKDNDSLTAGMKSLCGRLGKAIRKITGGSGSVFKGRFHLEVIKSPTQMKRALEYVLLNASKHFKLIEHIDDFSSGYAFREWRALIGERFGDLIEDQLMKLPFKLTELSPAQSWLCRVGWMRA
ncbi:MAG: transposase [Bdellovibrionales bacterium]